MSDTPVQQSKQVAPIDDIRGTLTRMQPQFAAALPAHVTPEKFLRVVMTAIQKNMTLLNADRASLYGACMAAAQQGLLPDGREGAIVPFKNKAGDQIATWMPMTAGILKLVRNSGELSTITAQVIYKNDAFRYWVDDQGEHVEHTPLLFGDPGEPIGVYALAKVKDGGIYVEVMTASQVNQIRSVSRAKDGPAWTEWTDEMWKKSAIRRLSKRLPMSTDIDEAVRSDDEMYDLKQIEAKPAAEKSSRLAAIVAASTTPEEPPI